MACSLRSPQLYSKYYIPPSVEIGVGGGKSSNRKRNLSEWPGTIVIYKRQQYEFEGLTPYTRQDGSETSLAVFKSNCKRCGEPFVTSKAIRDGEPYILDRGWTRRCPRHTIRRKA